jgi:hypothetical protein
MASALVERYDDRISGVLSCYDRVVVTGTLPSVCYAVGMTRFLYANQIRIFDYPAFAATLRDHVRERAAAVAAEAGISVEHVSKSHVRKEAIVAKVLDQRGAHPGLVHVISAMEACDAYKPWHDKPTHKTYLRPHPSPHFAADRNPPNNPLLTSISANRCISGNSRCSGMFGISS